MSPQVKAVPYYVYILASKKNGTLYIGVTNDLVRRVHEHREGVVDSFTKKYGVHRLVFFEVHDYGQAAIQRERTMKHWRREWKVALIEEANPDWCDLFDSVAG
jgi:putative endonuclease